MKKTLSVFASLVLAASMCGTAFAKRHHNNGNPPPNSQAGGLPALAAKVSALTTLVNQQGTEINGLESAVGQLQGQVSDLQGQNNWVVVDSGGTAVRQNGTLTPVKVTPDGSGLYEVVFASDVSKCAYNATVDVTGVTPPAPGGYATVLSDPNDTADVEVETFGAGALETPMGFDLHVSCPNP